MDESLFEYGQSIAQELNTRLNLKNKVTLTFNQRDVPHTTRSIVRLLAKYGVRAVSIGVNGASAPPAVPPSPMPRNGAFIWRDSTSSSEVISFIHPGGYGGIEVSDCVMIPGFDHALATMFRGDNAGPPNTLEVTYTFKHLKEEFPNALIKASSFDDFVDPLVAAVESGEVVLPIVESEIGDTWIYGGMSSTTTTKSGGKSKKKKKTLISIFFLFLSHQV